MNKQETIPFQTETVKLLQMMIHSVYTTKEVFLRELIANASDAIDKRFALALEHPDDKIGPVTRESYMIRITPNKEKRLLTISDNGIGMDADDLRRCLGTIAFSGSGLFQEETFGESVRFVPAALHHHGDGNRAVRQEFAHLPQPHFVDLAED